MFRYVEERRRRGEFVADTAENAISTLLSFSAVVGQRPLERLGPRDVERWLESKGHLAPSTRRNQFSKVAHFCRWLCRRGHTRIDIAGEVDPPKQPRSVPRALSPASIDALYDVLPDARARVLFWLGYGLGMREIEMERLELADWDRSAHVVVVRGKGGHQRYIPVEPRQAVWALESYLEEHPAAGGPIVRSYNRPQHALTAQAISRMGTEWMYAAGIKRHDRDGVSWHALRHTAATELLDGGADIRVVQEFLGHQHLSSTSIYLARAGVGRVRDALRARSFSAGGSPGGAASVTADLIDLARFDEQPAHRPGVGPAAAAEVPAEHLEPGRERHSLRVAPPLPAVSRRR